MLRSLRHILLLCALGLVHVLHGQGAVPSQGTEFWLGFMRNWGLLSTSGSLDVFISGDVATSGTVSMPLTGQSWPFTVVPGTTTTVTVPMSAIHGGSEAIENKGVLVQSADTVSVFAFNYEPNTVDGTVVYPVGALGIEHRLFSYTGIPTGPNAGSEFLVVATKDGTELEIITTAQTLMGRAPGVPWTVQLDSGQTYHVRAALPSMDFTGTVIRGTEASGACRPFAVFSGSSCSEVPTGCWACDHLFDQALPVQLWGTTYHAVPFLNTNGYVYRIMAHTNGTQVRVNGGAPIILNAGQFFEEGLATTATCFTADRPFAVAQYMRGMHCSGSGDPSMLVLGSAEQRIRRITFSTVVSPIISQHNINIVVPTAAAGNVHLDGTLLPATSFLPFPGCPDVSYARLPITQGSHSLECPDGLSAYVYGTGEEESYAYSVGASSTVPPLPIEHVICGTDVDGMVTLAPPRVIDDPIWVLRDAPADTLFRGTPYVFRPDSNAIYEVHGYEGVSGCPVSFAYSVELPDPPTIGLSAGSVQVCAQEPVPLAVHIAEPGLFRIAWEPAYALDDSTLRTPLARIAQDTWFRVTVSTLNGCASAVDSILVHAAGGSWARLRIAPADTAICRGAELPLRVSAQRTVVNEGFNAGTWGAAWIALQGAAVNTDCGSVTGAALHFNGGIQRQATLAGMDLSQGGTVRFHLIIGTGVAPCEDADPGDDVVLEYSVDGGGTWQQLALFAEWAYPAFTPVEVELTPGSLSVSTRLRWRQLGTWTTGQDNWAIDDVQVLAHGALPLGGTWSPSDPLFDPMSGNYDLAPDSSAWYRYTVADPGADCWHTDSVRITVFDPFHLALTADTVVCSALGLLLEAEHDAVGANLHWEPAGALATADQGSTLITQEGTRTYVVTVTDQGGCSRSDSVHVAVPLSSLQPLADVSACVGDTVVLDPRTPGATHQWSNGSTADTLLVSTAGSYSVRITVPGGCADSLSAIVSFTPLPLVELGSDTTLCQGDTLRLDAGAHAAVRWNDGSGGRFRVVTADGRVHVSVTDALGCIARDSVLISVRPTPIPLLRDTVACADTELYMDAGVVDLQYAWTTGDTLRRVRVPLGVDSIGVRVTDGHGCSGFRSVRVQRPERPQPQLGSDTVLCAGSSMLLDAAVAAERYSWSTGASGRSITVYSSGLYRVEAANGPCAAPDSVRVDVRPVPAPELPQLLSICPDQPPYGAWLRYNGNGSIRWTLPNGEQQNGDTALWVTAEGLYGLLVTDGSGCSGAAETRVRVTCPGHVWVPNAFTPNGDPHNQLFRPVAYNVLDLELMVFNRWGELIYHGFGADAAWDGSYANEVARDGVYPWRLLYTAIDDSGIRQRIQRFGHVVLLR